MEANLPDFRKGQVEKIETKLEKCSVPRALKGNFYCLSFNGKNIPHFTILTPNALFDPRIVPENSKKLCF